MRTPHGPAQAYNAQAVCTREHIIIATEITTAGPDFGQLGPMIQTARRELKQVGVASEPATVLADSGYWNQDAMDHLAADGITVLIPPDAKTRSGTHPAGTAAATRSCAPFSKSPRADGATPDAKA